VEVLLQEFDRWKAMPEDLTMAPLFADFQKSLREKVVKPIFAEPFVAQLATIAVSDADTLDRLAAFAVFMGEDFVPLLLEQMRNVQDKDHRARLCALLTQVGKSVGVKPLVEALADPDWFLVVNVVGILNDVADPANATAVAPCLKNGHPKVREAAVKFLGKFGCVEGASALADFIGTTTHAEETGKAVIAISLLSLPGIDEMLLKAYAQAQDYQTKVSVVRGLGRQGSAKVVAFLKETARRSWYEILSGLNKELRKAAKEALESVKKEGHA
jgi:HEAT repeat protein